ncbi:hypothetical protein CHUAL_006705 [Chamberlinius hualienensis]
MTFFALIILITTYIQFVIAQQLPTCNGDTYGNVYDFVNGVSNCIFPYYKITSDIVRGGCPQLTTESLCPFNADKSLNKINISKTVEIVNDCLKQPTIGNIELNRIKFPPASYSANEILQRFGLTGECGVSQHTSFFDNINNTLITVTDVQDTFVVSQSSTTCDGNTYGDVDDFVNGVSNCLFPYDKITSDIVRDGCPQLTTESLCPFNADKSLNKINIEKTVKIVKNCLKQPTIGGNAINPFIFPLVTYAVNDILQEFGLTGECTVPSNINFIYNLNNTLISVTDVKDLLINISITASQLILKGAIDCKFTLPLVKIPIPINNIGYLGTLAFTSKSSISSRDNNTPPEIQSPDAELNAQFGFTQNPLLSNIPLGSLFSYFYNKIINQTKASKIFGKFISAFINGALEITKTQCS